MSDSLSGNTIVAFGLRVPLWAWPVLQLGIDSNGNPQPIAVSTSGQPQLGAATGAAHVTCDVGTATNSAATMLVARPTRTAFRVQNLDASLGFFVGPVTVDPSAHAYYVGPGADAVFTSIVLWQIIAPSGSPQYCVVDEFN